MANFEEIAAERAHRRSVARKAYILLRVQQVALEQTCSVCVPNSTVPKSMIDACTTATNGAHCIIGDQPADPTTTDGPTFTWVAQVATGMIVASEAYRVLMRVNEALCCCMRRKLLTDEWLAVRLEEIKDKLIAFAGTENVF